MDLEAWEEAEAEVVAVEEDKDQMELVDLSIDKEQKDSQVLAD